MCKFLQIAAKWFDRLNNLLAFLACGLLVAIIIAICIEICTRSFLDISNPWLVELSEITLLYSTFMAAAWVLGRDKHVSLDLILNSLNERLSRYMHMVLSTIAAIACFTISWFGVLTVIDQFQNEIREPTIMAPLTFWITSIVPFGLFLLGIQFLRRGIRSMAGLSFIVGSVGQKEG
jgi:C4-dicarboxylate transporter DctQ subunit